MVQNRLICVLVCAGSLFPPQPSWAEEVSLKEDGKSIEELRKAVPEEKRAENDELGFILNLFSDFSRSSSSIQQEFNRWLEKNRQKKRREWQRRLTDYNQQEKAKRRDFMQAQKEKRKSFLAQKPARAESERFFADEKARSESFFLSEREARRDFQSDLDAEKKLFESGWRDRRQQFNEKLQEFKQIQKSEKAKDQSFGSPRAPGQLSPEYRQYLEDFDKIPKTPAEPLRPQTD